MDAKCKKVKFRIEADALFYIQKLENTSTRKTIPIRAYLCPYCTSWHLTSKVEMTSNEIKISEELKTQILILKETVKRQKIQISALELRIHTLKTKR